MLQEKPGSSCSHSKRLQISKSIRVEAKFISDAFSWRRTGLAKVGVKRHRFRAGRGKGGKRPWSWGLKQVWDVMKKLHID